MISPRRLSWQRHPPAARLEALMHRNPRRGRRLGNAY